MNADAPAAGKASGSDAAETDARPDNASQEPSPAPARRSGTPLILLLLVVLVAAFAFYAGVWQPHEAEVQARAAATDERVAAAEQRVNALSEELSSGVEQLSGDISASAATASKAASDSATLKRTTDNLEASVKALYARQSEASLDWILAEVEYLVVAASQRLALERDVATASAALTAADQRLRAAEHPELIPLRETLAASIGELNAVPDVDVEGMAIGLADMVTRVDTLPTRPVSELDMSFSRMSDEQAGTQDWRGVARSLWADIRSLVEIKDGELEDGVLFDPELRYFLQQNLRLELSSARLAVLQRDSANFAAATRLVINLLEKYYDTENAAVAAMIKQLSEQQDTDLAPALPSITASLDAVRAKRQALRDKALAGS